MKLGVPTSPRWTINVAVKEAVLRAEMGREAIGNLLRDPDPQLRRRARAERPSFRRIARILFSATPS